MINEKLLDELEKKIKEYRMALRRKLSLAATGDKIQMQVPFFNKQVEYVITQEDRDLVENGLNNKEKELKDKLKEIDK